MSHKNPSRQPIMRTALRTISPVEAILAIVVWAGVASALAQRADGQELPDPRAADQQEQADRLAVWNSPAMLSARSWLEEYFRTSRQSPPAVEQAYLEHLSKLSADEMRDWLKQMHAMRGRRQQEQIRTDYVRKWDYQQSKQTQVARQAKARAARAVVAAQPPVNFVQPASARRAAEAAAQQNRYTPLPSFQMLFLLDTIDIRNDLRELRRSR